MALTIAPLFSSSKGNCTYIASDNAQILVDCGKPVRNVLGQLRRTGEPLHGLAGVLVTHEHSDHIQSVGAISRQMDVPVYANEQTWEAMEAKIGPVAPRNVRVIGEDDFYIRDLCVQPFRTSHDAACPCGYTVTCGGKRVAVMTDLGRVTQDILDKVRNSRIVLLESNYDPEMLRNGPYPIFLQRRIASTKGHLSNPDAAAAAAQLVERGVKGILLGHLSENNNRSVLALQTSRDHLNSLGIVPGKHVALGVARRGGLTGVFHV